ncbi:hypothetical protein Daus18300_011769 [Diaporthe australafricana]|uniref:histidine kinase n=1 Tax=Diaporthe australafricana TaxID=127596 RepID=A0ABR3W589_9PEZI
MLGPDFEQLANAGLSVFDLNSEYLAQTDWSETPLAQPPQWPQSLSSYISLIKAFPHPAAVFWGPKLSLIHNFAWGAASNSHDGQGSPSIDHYRGEARAALQSAVTGRTVRIGGDTFFKNSADQAFDVPVMICPLLDDRGHRQGALAQSLDGPASQRSLDNELLGQGSGPELSVDRHMQDSSAFLDKSEKDQDEILSKAFPPDHRGDLANAVSRHGHIDFKQSQLFQRFAELLPTGLAILNHNAEAVFVNDQFFSLTTKKMSREFRSWPESIDPRDYERVMTEYCEAFRERRDVKVEFRCVCDEGEKTEPDNPEIEEWRMFLLRPLNSTRTSGYICAVVDVTELKTAELAQERTARDAKDRKQQQERFIDMVSHEIRNPLSAVLHLAEEIKETSKAMEEHGRQSDQVAEIIDAADTILVCVSHQSVLVDDILNFSKLDSAMMSLAPSVSQPKLVLSQQLKVFQAELKTNRIELDFALDVSLAEHGLDWVLADLARIKQVLVNLMTNAIKFTARKNGERRITVAVGATDKRPSSYPPDAVFFNDSIDEKSVDQTGTPEWGDGPVMYMMIAVKDTGIGISTQDQVRLFERFRQATPKTSEKYGGSGLGLSISRKLCQLHGGDIGVGSNEGRGSTFGFYFKVRRASPPPDLSGPASGRSTPMRQSSTESIPVRPKPQSRAQSFRTNVASIDESERDEDKVQDGRSITRKISDRPGIGAEKDTTPILAQLVHRESAVSSGSGGDGGSSRPQRIANEVDQQKPKNPVQRYKGGSVLDGQETVSRNKQEVQTGDQPQPRGTLLLVEDNMINQKVLKRQLQNHGFQVFTASNGQEAVDAVVDRAKGPTGTTTKTHSKEDKERFSCILMDQEMPVMDGNTAAREIKTLQAKGEVGRTPILGVSANVRDEQTKLMKEAGMDEVISKPFKVKDLVKKIDGLAEIFEGGSAEK